MSKKNGKANNPLVNVTIGGVPQIMTLEEAKAAGKVCTASDLKRMRELGKGLFRNDDEFEKFQKWLRKSRKGS